MALFTDCLQWVGPCEFLTLEYSVEYLIEYSSTGLIKDVAINYSLSKTYEFMIPHTRLLYNNGFQWVKIPLL